MDLVLILVIAVAALALGAVVGLVLRPKPPAAPQDSGSPAGSASV